MTKKCAEENCNLTAGWWIEKDADGQYFCYNVRHNGKPHKQRIAFEEIEQIIRDATGFKTATVS